jgi:hypothetical protein
MNTPTPPNRRAPKGAMVIGASSVALGLVAAVGLLWVGDSGEAAISASGQPSAHCLAAAVANAVFAAL